MKVEAGEMVTLDHVNERVRDVIVKTFKVGAEDRRGDLRMGSVRDGIRLAIGGWRWSWKKIAVSIATLLVGQLLDVDSIAGTILELQAEK